MQYVDIEKMSEVSNRIIKNGIDDGHQSPDIEIFFGGKIYEMDILKNNRSTSVNVVEFFDHFLKRKRFVLIFLPYKELINYGIIYEKKDKKSDVAGFSLKIRKKGDKTYISKNLFFDGNGLVSK